MKLFKKSINKEKALKIINEHLGKKRVYETYLQFDPVMADKYLMFITRNVNAQYISWDEKNRRFVR